ncbi:proline racemase family protein [Kribbella sp. NPDC050124]|uniref:proline racemase family protein n=1 Tax=Kribbella sp. NPDC050124 TaxID=3364114 RepID=UPI00379D122D
MRWSRVFNVVEAHAGGEINKVLVGGFGDVPGGSVFEKMKYIEANRDDVRRLLLHEPRGGVTHCVNILVPSSDPEASMGYVIAESTEYPAMSGSNTICTSTVLLETGILPMSEPVTDLVLEAPAGLIRVRCDCKDGKVTGVTFVNQPAFVYHLGATIEVEGIGSVPVDVAWGGMAYVLADAGKLGFDLDPSEGRELCEVGQRLKAAGAEQLEAVHPVNPEFPGITQTEFTGPMRRENGVLTSKNAVIVSPGRLDRSPCGTGTSARLAVMHARGEIGVGEEFVHESIIGSVFGSRIVETTTVGGVPAVTPSVTGQAWITEMCQVGLDPTDPFPTGYALGDTWPSEP